MSAPTIVEPDCPKCGARPGEPCRTRGGKRQPPRPMKTWHRDRAEAAGFSPTQYINAKETK